MEQRERHACVFFNHTPTTEIYTLSLRDALPIFPVGGDPLAVEQPRLGEHERARAVADDRGAPGVRLAEGVEQHRRGHARSEEHTSELQSRQYLVCRLLLEKKNQTHTPSSLRLSH